MTGEVKYPFIQLDVRTSANRWEGRLSKPIHVITLGDVTFHQVDGYVLYAKRRDEEYFLKHPHIDEIYPRAAKSSRCGANEMKVRLLGMLMDQGNEILTPIMEDLIKDALK